MTRFVALSIMLHLVAGLLLYYGVPSIRKDVSHDYAIVMDIVTVSELTNIKAHKLEQKPDAAADSNEVKPVSAAPSEPEVKPEPKDVKQQEVVEEKAESLPDKLLKQEEKKEEKKIEVKDKKTQNVFSESFLKNMEAKIAKKDQEQEKKKKIFDKKDDSVKADTNKSYNDTMPMSISEIDAIRSQVQKSWNVTSFSNADDRGMQVTLHIKLDIDGNALEVRSQKGSGNSKYYQAFVDSAIRAVKLASPLKGLPKDKYGTWKEIEFVFDSSGMIY